MIESTPDRASNHSPSIALRMLIAATTSGRCASLSRAVHPIAGRTPDYSDLLNNRKHRAVRTGIRAIASLAQRLLLLHLQFPEHSTRKDFGTHHVDDEARNAQRVKPFPKGAVATGNSGGSIPLFGSATIVIFGL